MHFEQTTIGPHTQARRRTAEDRSNQRQAGEAGQQLVAPLVGGNGEENGALDRRCISAQAADGYDVIGREASLMGLADGR